MKEPLEPGEWFVEANGVRLHCLRWPGHNPDDAALPPVLMLHATGFLGRLWEPVAQAMTSRYTVYAIDTRGHGDSEKPLSTDHPAFTTRQPYDWHSFADDAAAFMDGLGLRGIPLIGHSSGGATAAYLAATRPEYASALVLIEPIIRPTGFNFSESTRNDMAEAARRRRTVWPSREEMLETYRGRPTFAAWREDVLRLYVEHGTFQREDGQVELKCSGEVEAQVYDNSTSLDLWDRLPQITCPTLVLRGQTTDPYLVLISDAASKRVPGASLGLIEGAGHLAPMERPEAIAAAILEFLGNA